MIKQLGMVPRRGILAGAAAMVVPASVAMAAEAQAEGSLDRILRDKKVRIGWIASPPQMMKDVASGKLEGYFVDAARYIFKEIDVEPEFIETSFSTFVAGLQSDQIDLCIASTFVTIKRAAVVDFTRPLLYLGYSAIVRADETRFKSLAEFNQSGIRIAVLQGGSSQAYVKQNFPKAEIVALSSTNQTLPFVEVLSGRADVGINDAWSARRFAATQTAVKDLFANEPYNVQPTAWTVRKGNDDVLKFLNAAIGTILVNGKFEEMARAYDPSGRYKSVLQLVPFASK
jgi:polar amino acid transport system substrate-binding protein